MTVAVDVKKLTSALAGSAERLRSFWVPFRKVMTFSAADDSLFPAKSIAVSIERSFLSVVCGSRLLSKIRIKGFKSYPLGGNYPMPEGLASSVALAVGDLGAPKAEITLGIPKAWTVIRTAELPSAVRENISDVISYEIDRLTPFSAEQAFYDFKILKEDDGKLSLLLAAVKADLIRPYLEALKEKGFAVHRVTVNLSSVGALCRYANKCADAVFLKADEREYEGAIFSEGFMTGAFSGNFGSADERARLDILMGEVGPLLDAARGQGKSPELIVSLRDRSVSFREMLKLRTTLPLRFLEETEIPLNVSAKEVPCEAAGGVIESLWPKANGFNLLAKGREVKERPPVGVSFVLLAVVLLMWVLYLLSPLKIEGNRLEEIDQQIAMRKEEVKKVETLKKDIEGVQGEISAIADFKETRPMALILLRELTTILPKTAWLTRLRITATTVEIEGYASSATELLPKLESSKYLQKVEFSSPTFRDARMNADRFNIKMEIEGVKKKAEEKPKTGEKAKKEGEKPKSEKK
ncbi:MAG: PilN domain-containing protein [Nitrospirae bacterium]|nr:PilN domain-containing protein [Nitrospirota bacterium]